MSVLSQVLLTCAGFAVLIAGADFLIRGASAIARSFGVPPIVVGLTIVAYGTSLPEFMASFSAMRNGFTGIAVGNVLGSNVCNIALVLGVAALITPVTISKDVLKVQLPIAFIVTLASMIMLMHQNSISRWEALILVAGIVVYTLWLFKRPAGIETNDVIDTTRLKINPLTASAAVVAGCTGLYFGGELVVRGASALAETFRIPPRVIGGTIVALGTSLPELITTIIGILKKETDLGVGNAIGSCVFNILMLLGVTAAYKPVYGSVYEYRIEFLFCLLVIALLYPLSFRRFQLDKKQGVILVLVYVLFLIMMF